MSMASEATYQSSTIRKWGKAASQRPALRIKWAADPASGALTARWIIDGTQR